MGQAFATLVSVAADRSIKQACPILSRLRREGHLFLGNMLERAFGFRPLPTFPE